MLRFLRIVVLIGCSLFMVTGLVQAGDRQLSKSLQKECKKTVKMLKSEGWTVSGVSLSLDKAMEEHFLKLQLSGEGAMVIEGNGKGKSVNIAVRRAMSNASSQYATMRESDVEGRTEINISNNAADADSAVSRTSLNASYASSTSQKVKRFTPTVLLYRKLDAHNVEARAFYVVGNDE